MNEHTIQLIRKLSDPGLKGRVPGTEGHEKAKNLIIREFERLNLSPVLEGGYEQRFPVTQKVTGQNLLAMQKGSKKDWLLLGAHYDHVRGSPGADDNAASVGILFDVLETLAGHNLRLNIVVAAFDLEEPPYFLSDHMGSVYFYNHLPHSLDLDGFKGAIILDLCGHDIAIETRENALFAVGADSSPLLTDSAMQARKQAEDLSVYLVQGRPRFYLSDHYVFDIHQQPNLFLTCGHYPQYHSAGDTFERLNLDKVSNIAAFIGKLVMEADAKSEKGSLSPFTAEDERLEVARLIGKELPAHKSIEPLLYTLMSLIAKEDKLSLDELHHLLGHLIE